MIVELLIIPQSGISPSLEECSPEAARLIKSAGFKVRPDITVCESHSALAGAISVALSRSNVILILGGMGEKSGFIAKNVISEGLRIPLKDSAECLAAIKRFCAKNNEPFLPDYAALASIPTDAQAIVPKKSKLPGFIISSSRQHIIALPEDTLELLTMIKSTVVPRLVDIKAASKSVYTVRTIGIKRERISALLADFLAGTTPTVTIDEDADCANGEMAVRVCAEGADEQESAHICASALEAIVSRLGDYAYGLNVGSLEEAAITKLTNKNLRVAIAEAGTHGSFYAKISTPQNSEDVISYNIDLNKSQDSTVIALYNPDTLKDNLAEFGIPQKKLAKYGPVCEYTAVFLADCARERGECDIGVGICAAPPEYENPKGSGFVYIAVCNKESVYIKKLIMRQFDEADADSMIESAVYRALNMLRLVIDYHPGHYHAAVPLSSALNGKNLVTGRDSYDDNAISDMLKASRISAGKAILENFHIKKTDRFITKMKKFVFILMLLVFLACGAFLGYYYLESVSNNSKTEEYRNLYYDDSPQSSDTVPQDYPESIETRFASLWALNSDIIGFIKIDDTNIDYPVVQTTDNQFYMTHGFDKKDSNHGVPFLDFRNDIEKPSDNLIIYGHNMRDGQDFANLTKYNALDFYLAHSQISFDTLQQEGDYIIFAAFITQAFNKENPHEGIFNYHDMIDAASESDFESYLYQLKIRSIIDTGVDVNANDKILTLSTCSYDFDNARFVVVARQLRPGEVSVDVSSAKLNPAPLYPDIWYKTFGGEKPDYPSAYINTSSSEEPGESSGSGEDSSQDSSSLGSSATASQDESKQSDAASKLLAEQSEAEIKRLAAEQAAAAEASRIAAEQASAAEASRVAAEQASAAEASRVAAEQAAAAESSRVAAEQAASKATIQKNEEDTKNYFYQAEAAYLAVLEALDNTEAAQTQANAKKYSEAAQSEAAKAKTAADNAWNAAQIAKTQAALTYATEARDLANEAASSAKIAAEIVEYTQYTSTSTGNSSSGKIKNLTVKFNGKTYDSDAADIIARIVQNEMGSSFHPEAMKAQAVATYTYIMHSNAGGVIPTVTMATSASTAVKNAVSEVLGQAMYYKGSYAYTPYFSTSAGSTTSSAEVWGGSYPYLVSVDSSIEEQLTAYKVTTSMTRAKVASLISNNLGIDPTGDPADWFEVISYNSGGYNGKMSVCGETKSPKTGSAITGRMVRENVLSLRSACFDVEYDEDEKKFYFTTYGYGHGVGMSQNGANLYASQEGWDYLDILEHYYQGTTVN